MDVLNNAISRVEGTESVNEVCLLALERMGIIDDLCLSSFSCLLG